MSDSPRGYLEETLRQILATDPRVLEPELHIEIDDRVVVVTGVVPTQERHRAIDRVLAEQARALGRLRVVNRTEVAHFPPPTSQERIR